MFLLASSFSGGEIIKMLINIDSELLELFQVMRRKLRVLQNNLRDEFLKSLRGRILGVLNNEILVD